MKRLTSVLTMMILALSLTACAGENGPGSTAGSAAPTTTAASAQAAETKETQGPGSSAAATTAAQAAETKAVQGPGSSAAETSAAQAAVSAPETSPASSAAAPAETKTETQAQTQTEAQAQTQTEAQAQTQAETSAAAPAEAQAQAPAAAETSAQTSAAAESAAPAEAPKPQKEVLVVYFSATGTTKDVAEKIAAITDADLYEIQAAQPYTDADLNWHDSNSRTTHEQNDSSVRPAIGSSPVSLEGYSRIYVGYPIWWGEEPRILDTFVESYQFDGKTMIPFCTSASSGIGRSGKNLAEHAGSGNWLDGKRFGAGPSEESLRSWIQSLQ